VVLQEAEKYAAKVDVDNSGMALIFLVYAVSIYEGPLELLMSSDSSVNKAPL